MQGHIGKGPTVKSGPQVKARVLSLTSSSRHPCEKDTVIIHYVVNNKTQRQNSVSNFPRSAHYEVMAPAFKHRTLDSKAWPLTTSPYCISVFNIALEGRIFVSFFSSTSEFLKLEVLWQKISEYVLSSLRIFMFVFTMIQAFH